MAFKVINFSELPVIAKGPQSAAAPGLTIKANGQVTFNVKASEYFKASNFVIPLWDEEKRILAFTGAVDPTKKEQVHFELKTGNGKNKKSKYFSGSRLLAYAGYDYKASGDQAFVFDHVDEKKTNASFTLPKSLPPRPKQVRKPRVKAATGKPNSVATPSNGDEKELELADIR